MTKMAYRRRKDYALHDYFYINECIICPLLHEAPFRTCTCFLVDNKNKNLTVVIGIHSNDQDTLINPSFFNCSWNYAVRLQGQFV